MKKLTLLPWIITALLYRVLNFVIFDSDLIPPTGQLKYIVLYFFAHSFDGAYINPKVSPAPTSNAYFDDIKIFNVALRSCQVYLNNYINMIKKFIIKLFQKGNEWIFNQRK